MEGKEDLRDKIHDRLMKELGFELRNEHIDVATTFVMQEIERHQKPHPNLIAEVEKEAVIHSEKAYQYGEIYNLYGYQLQEDLSKAFTQGAQFYKELIEKK